MGKLSCLHISDLHIGDSKYDEDFMRLSIQVSSDLKDQKKPIDAVIVSGDIFNGRTKNDAIVDIAVNFFNDLIVKLNNAFQTNITEKDFIFVPGNHDIERIDDGHDFFPTYRKFLNKFHGESSFKSLYNKDDLFTIRVYEKEKVVIVGLNSCWVEKKTIDSKELKWQNNINFDELELSSETLGKVKEKILDSQKEFIEKSWDDYGYIKSGQVYNAFQELNSQIEVEEYSIVTTFHHHFYPFPEKYGKLNDISIIKNFDEIVRELSRYNVKIVLHGHKHVPIQRPIVTDKYFKDPTSTMYAFSAGSLGCKRTDNMSFQVVELFSPDEYLTTRITRFDYTLDELSSVDTIQIPPKTHEVGTFIEILEILKIENKELYQKYQEIFDSNNIFSEHNIEKIIDNISKTISKFEMTRKKLKDNPKYIFLILITIMYRIVILAQIRDKKVESKTLEVLDEIIKKQVCNGEYHNDLISLLSQNNMKTFKELTKKIMDNSNFSKDKSLTSFIVITLYFTDLFLTLRKYGEFYYKEESINHKINIKLEHDRFHIPVASIGISSEEDRRTATVNFTCDNPTVHKIAVLIVKDFEDTINSIEDSFKEIGLKIYYIKPTVEKKGYDMDDYNFEAYIPTLLPLLTGDNLYNQKEVFARELIQNSYDAIELRSRIQPTISFDKDIHIRFGKEKDAHGNERSYIQIRDNGIGMDIFKIERYFTSIGRSFYRSDEFAELQEDNKIEYKAVSNFGIGFLSAFMVVNEINVKTNSYIESEEALDIDIPNYEGCFFIKKYQTSDIGTIITLYEDINPNAVKKLDEKKIVEYIKEIFGDFGLTIKIEQSNGKTVIIDKYKLKTELIKNNVDFLYIPFKEDGFAEIEYKEIKTSIENHIYPYGLIIDLDTRQSGYHRRNRKEYNSGIKITEETINIFPEKYQLIYCFPSSYLQLDVAREKINSFRFKEEGKKFLEKNIFKSKLNDLVVKQSLNAVQFIKKNNKNKKLTYINDIFMFCKSIDRQYTMENLYKELYAIKLSLNDDFDISIVSVNDKRDRNSLYLYPGIDKTIFELIHDKTVKQEVLFYCYKYFINILDGKESAEKFGREFAREFGKESVEKFGRKFENKLGIEFKKRFEERFGRELEKRFGREFKSKFEGFGSKFEGFERELEEFGRELEKRFGREFEREFERFERELKEINLETIVKIILYHLIKTKNIYSFTMMAHFLLFRYFSIADVDKIV